jgi:cephalosporin hydroxylase
MHVKARAKSINCRTLYPLGKQIFFEDLMQRTGNFSKCKWLGVPIQQNILDLWTTQETIAEIRPDLLALQDRSALFYANLI